MDDILEIAFGRSRSDTNWKTEYISWAELVQRLRKVRRTGESMADYDRMSSADKHKVKDGPSFVGGSVRGGRRKKENVETRSLITLDADHANDDFLLSVDLAIGGNAYAIYSTHSHRPKRPKHRLVMPASRPMQPDEYAAVSRRVADWIDLLTFDRTTFDVHRLMYLPSCSKDAEPELHVADGEPIDVDAVLATYDDWRDPASWPRHPDDEKVLAATVGRLGDPGQKPGVIGAFCRVYGVLEGMELFIPEAYEPTSTEDRWTYAGGSSVGGLRIYDDQWVYSEHQSDPANDGHCHNIFDLVRIHRFGELDADVKPGTAGTKYPSHKAMIEFACEDPAVKRELLLSDFDDDLDDDEDLDEPDEAPAARPAASSAGGSAGNPKDDNAWVSKLKVNPKNPKVPLPIAYNAEIILTHGPFKGVLAYDAFGNTEVVRGPLPWRPRERPQREYEPWLGADDKRLQHWFAKRYSFKSSGTIQNAFTEVVHRNTFHPIKEYLESLAWDGRDRIDELFIRYLGAEDTHYVRQVTRKMFIAAVKRIYEPGCKFDQMLTLVGPQGAGKSSLLAKLGRKWFSDSLRTFDNKEAGEHLQGAWIFEIGELAALKKTEVEEVKQFLSKTEDRYRVAYDRQVSEFPRKCVFFGTTNNYAFLRDQTGNRRFWPVDVDPARRKESHFDSFTDADVGQIWAEAFTLYMLGEGLELDRAAALEAERIQGLHLEDDPRGGLIREYLETPHGDDIVNPEGRLPQRVCALEIWMECLGRNKGDMKSWDAKEICELLRKVPGWAERKGRARLPVYGLQTVFERISNTPKE